MYGKRAGDYNTVFQVVTDVFSHVEHSDGNERELVTTLGAIPSFIPNLFLAATGDDEIVGVILFAKITIGECTELALAPFSVFLAYQRIEIR